MGLRINQNIMAMNAYRNLGVSEGQLGKSLEKLSSGFRINRAADDAAGLVISEGLRSQVSGLKVAVRNSQDGVSVVQTAEGALTEVHSLLQRMRDLAVQASNAGASDSDARAAAQAEIVALRSEVDRIAQKTKFGAQNLLDGTYGKVDGKAVGFLVESAANQFTVTAADSMFNLTVDPDSGGPAAAVTLTDVTVAAGAYNASGFETALNNAIGSRLQGAGIAADTVTAKVTDEGGSWRVEFTSKQNTTFNTAGTAANDLLANLNIANATTANPTGSGGVFQVGANYNESISVSISDLRVSATGLNIGSVDVTDTTRNNLADIDAAIKKVSQVRGDLGAVQNRFEHTIANLSVTAENLAASESRIRDTDMAEEMLQFTRAQILQQAGTGMLAQANSVPQTVLQLLR